MHTDHLVQRAGLRESGVTLWVARKPESHPDTCWVGIYTRPLMRGIAVGNSEEECRDNAKGRLGLFRKDPLPAYVKIQKIKPL